MANNRLFIVHRSSGKAVYLGKRMGWEWYGAPDDLSEKMEAFFRAVQEVVESTPGSKMDDFAIALEYSDDPCVVTNWEYTIEKENGHFRLKIKEEGSHA